MFGLHTVPWHLQESHAPGWVAPLTLSLSAPSQPSCDLQELVCSGGPPAGYPQAGQFKPHDLSVLQAGVQASSEPLSLVWGSPSSHGVLMGPVHTHFWLLFPLL